MSCVCGCGGSTSNLTGIHLIKKIKKIKRGTPGYGEEALQSLPGKVGSQVHAPQSSPASVRFCSLLKTSEPMRWTDRMFRTALQR